MLAGRYLAYLVTLMLCAALLAAPALAGGVGPCMRGSSTSVPEPTALALLGVGVAGVLAIRKRINRK